MCLWTYRQNGNNTAISHMSERCHSACVVSEGWWPSAAVQPSDSEWKEGTLRTGDQGPSLSSTQTGGLWVGHFTSVNLGISSVKLQNNKWIILRVSLNFKGVLCQQMFATLCAFTCPSECPWHCRFPLDKNFLSLVFNRVTCAVKCFGMAMATVRFSVVLTTVRCRRKDGFLLPSSCFSPARRWNP